jgi:2-polyprenyl-3-methyl-5-hydroxy-6-metoxy-1,4-benzoquinol methylase
MLTNRSQEKELLDLGPDYYSRAEYVDCLKKLFRINQILGCFRNTVKIIKLFTKENLTILDVGCGGGLFLLHLNRIFPHMKMVGMDISIAAIEEAQLLLFKWKKINPNINVCFKLQRGFTLTIPNKSFDIILSTFVCHHLSDEALILFLQQLVLTARKKVIIHDLQRHYIAYWLYKLFSPLLFRNRLITHDGLISIKRSFTRKEWILLLKKAGLHDYKLKWRFPFRWQLILFCHLS